MPIPISPDFSLEDATCGPVCGVDEVGRGPIAGPVVAACVYVLDRDAPLWREVRDSKRLSPARREALEPEIRAHALWGLGEASVVEIDAANIRNATFLAMARAFEAMGGPPGMSALIDGNAVPPGFPAPAQAVVKGDARSASIAAASILAKVARDRTMAALAAAHAGYGWEDNAGYPTPAHKAALEALGPTLHHRTSFAPVQKVLSKVD